MKKAEEYLKRLFEEPFQLEEGTIEWDFLQVIKQAQIETIEYTVKRCAEEAEIELSYHKTEWMSDDIELEKPNYFDEINNIELLEELGDIDNVTANYWKATVDKQSILNVADKIKTEING